MFDFFRDMFNSLFGKDDNENEVVNWDGSDGDEISFAPDIEGGAYDALEMAYSYGDRIIEDPGGGEYVQEFYDLQQALDYVEPAPEGILMIVIDPDENEVYHVYRFDS